MQVDSLKSMDEKEFFKVLKSSGAIQKKTISEPIILREGSIEHKVSLYESVFEQKVIFDSIHFQERVEIIRSTFLNGFSCLNCSFDKGISVDSFKGKRIGFFLNKGSFAHFVAIIHVHRFFLDYGDFDSFSVTGLQNSEISKHISRFYAQAYPKRAGEFRIEGINANKMFLYGSSPNIKTKIFNVSTKDLTISNFTSTMNFQEVIPKSDFAKLKFKNCNLNEVQFMEINFNKYESISFDRSLIANSEFINCNWEGARITTEVSMSTINSNQLLYDIYSQLRSAYQSLNDPIRQSYFYELEMNAYLKLLNGLGFGRMLFGRKSLLV